MSKAQVLGVLVKQRLVAAAEEIFGLFEEAIAEYEEEIKRLRLEPKRSGEDVCRFIVRRKEEVPPEQDRTSSLHQKDKECPQIKEEHEQLQPLPKVAFAEFDSVSVKSEEDEEKTQYSIYYHSQSVDAEDCRTPDTNDKTTYSSEAEAKTKHDQRSSVQPQSGSNFLKNRRCDWRERTFCCSACGKRFSQNSNLKTHMRNHTGEKPFSCSVCSQRFVQKVHLRHHMARHTGEKLFGCSTCDQRFHWLYQLKSHRCVNRTAAKQTEGSSLPLPVSHEGHWTKKQFPCSQCGRVFSLKDTLLRHLRCHTGEKPFSCTVCGKKFRERGNMGQHMVIHTREKRFSCSICDQSFCWRTQLKKHRCESESSSSLHTSEVH